MELKMLGRILTTFSLMALPAFASSTGFSAADDAQEFSCGTFMVGGGFYADAGFARCDDGKNVIEKSSAGGRESDDIFCSYSAHCTPATPAFKETIMKKLGKKKWADISDDEISKTMIEEYRGAKPGTVEIVPVQVQCMGKKVDGKARCPSVNGCVNNRQASLLWKLKPFTNMDPNLADSAESEGFKARKGSKTAPSGVIQ
jgi:hypothetical protein